MSRIKAFDPACGSGNFLIITYKELRALEIKIIQRLIELEEAEAAVTYQGKMFGATPLEGTQAQLYGGRQRNLFHTQISLTQFYGIEIKDFAHEMALLGLWLAEHQMNKVFDERLEGYGQSKPILPLKEAGHITLGNAARIDWNDACPREKDDEIYVLGNPPYLGSFLQNKIQKEDLALACSGFKSYKDLDYIACWFIKATRFLEKSKSAFAFVTTNSICQGEQVGLLWPHIINKGFEIHFAYKSFKWTNNAKGNAGVTVTIIGVRSVVSSPKYFFDDKIKKEAKSISPYLTEGNCVIIYKRTKPLSLLPLMNYGSKIVDEGNLIFTTEEKTNVLKAHPNAERLFKKLLGSAEFIRGLERWCLYINDEDLSFATNIPEIARRLEAVTIFRKKSTEKSTREMANYPHRFYYSAHEDSEAIIIPRTSSERRDYIPLGFLNNDIIVSDAASVLFNATPWIFGVLHSKMHMVWVKAVGGRLKTDYRYSAQLIYNTFPFPGITAKQKEIINQYVFAVLDERAKFPEKTMAWLYNPDTMPAGLRQAHKELDLAIENIYRPGNPFGSDAERLEHLFKRYEEMIARETLFAKAKKPRAKKGA